jgi:hypothetical protein
MGISAMGWVWRRLGALMLEDNPKDDVTMFTDQAHEPHKRDVYYPCMGGHVSSAVITGSIAAIQSTSKSRYLLRQAGHAPPSMDRVAAPRS